MSELIFTARTTPSPEIRIATSAVTDGPRSRGRPITTWAIVRPSTTSYNGYVLVDPHADPLIDTFESEAAEYARSQNPRYRAVRASDFYYRRYASATA